MPTFDELYPDAEPFFQPIVDIGIFKDEAEGECAFCGAVTRWRDICYNELFCSEYCYEGAILQWELEDIMPCQKNN